MKVLVTGASGGIGSAIVNKFLSCGFDVTGFDLVPNVVKPSASEAAKWGKYIYVSGDICSSPLPNEAFDVVVNCAGVQGSGRDIEVNLGGTIRVTEKYIGSAKSIVFVASASATTGSEFPEYAASKGGMVTYMKNVALRMAERGGIANSISPGGVLTSLNECVMSDPKLWQEIMDETPLRKWATAEEIAEWVYFVAVVNKSMTAQDIIVDNGESARAKFVWKE